MLFTVKTQPTPPEKHVPFMTSSPSTASLKIFFNEISKLPNNEFHTGNSKPNHCKWEIWGIRMYTVGYYYLSLPIQFNKKSGKFCKSPFLVQIMWHLRLLWLVLDTLYLISRIPSVTPSSEGGKEFLNFYVHTVTRWMAAVLGILVAADQDGIVELLNTLFKTRCVWRGN